MHGLDREAAPEMRATTKPPSGRAILEAVRDELLLNLYPLPYSTLPVTIYHVYLFPADFDAIEAVVPRIVQQVGQALTAEVERFNARLESRGRRLLGRVLSRDEALAPIEVPAGGWEVHIRPDPDGELKPGSLGIISTLSLPRVAEYGGTPTARIVRSVVADGRRTVSATDVQAGTGAGPQETAPESAERARLTYDDEEGAHVFRMRKDAVSVGRGGTAAWVDVQVAASPKVSREHFRIRRDGDGRFFIQDVSSWGTSVNGQPIPPAVKSEAGVLQPGAEYELPRVARIELADALVVRFEASGSR